MPFGSTTVYTSEYARKKMRRSWAPERQKSDQARRVKARAHLQRYCPNPVKASDTVDMIRYEHDIVRTLIYSNPMWVPLWQLLNSLAGGPEVKEYQKRSVRQIYLSIITRLIQEGKIIRHRKYNKLAAAEWLRTTSDCRQPQV